MEKYLYLFVIYKNMTISGGKSLEELTDKPILVSKGSSGFAYIDFLISVQRRFCKK